MKAFWALFGVAAYFAGASLVAYLFGRRIGRVNTLLETTKPLVVSAIALWPAALPFFLIDWAHRKGAAKRSRT